MKVRLTSENLHSKNNDFSIFYDEKPPEWYKEGSTGLSQILAEAWQMEFTQTLVSFDFKWFGETANIYNYINIKKSASVAGAGQYSDNGIDYKTLTSIFENVPVTHNDTTLNRYYVAGGSGDILSIKKIKTELVIETEMLRTPQYQETKESSAILVHSKNSKGLDFYEKYKPIDTAVSFLTCIEEAQILKTYFATLAYYGKGFSIEVWNDNENPGWGQFDYPNQSWGGDVAVGFYEKKYYFNIANTNFVNQSTTGSLSVPVYLQKRDLDYAKY